MKEKKLRCKGCGSAYVIPCFCCEDPICYDCSVNRRLLDLRHYEEWNVPICTECDYKLKEAKNEEIAKSVDLGVFTPLPRLNA